MKWNSVIRVTTLSNLLAAAYGYGTTVSIPINYCPATYASASNTPASYQPAGQYILYIAQSNNKHKRAAGNSYLGAHGVVTTDPNQATIFKFTASGQLMSGSNYVSTSGTVVSQRFEALSVTSSITGTFAVDSSRNLAWHNETFGGGYAIFCFNQDFIQINFNGQANNCFPVELGITAFTNNNNPTTSTTIAFPSQMSSTSSYRSTTLAPGTSATLRSSTTQITTTLSSFPAPGTSSTIWPFPSGTLSFSASPNFATSHIASSITTVPTTAVSLTSTVVASISTTSNKSSLSTSGMSSIPLATSQTTTSSTPALVVPSSLFSSTISTVTSRSSAVVTSSSNAPPLTTLSSRSSSATTIFSGSSSSTSSSQASSSTIPTTSLVTTSLVPTSSSMVLTSLSSTPTTPSSTPTTPTIGYCQATPTTSSLCPAYNQQTLNVNDDGVCFEIECATYLQGNQLSGNATVASSLKACTSFCTLYNVAVPYGCVGVIYLNYQASSPNNCYLYSSVSGTTSLSGIDAARLIYPGYPYPVDLVSSSSTTVSSSALPSSSTSTTASTTSSTQSYSSTLGVVRSSSTTSTVTTTTTATSSPPSASTSPTTSSTVATSRISSIKTILSTPSPQSSSSSSFFSAAPPITATTTITSTTSTTSSSTTNCPSAPADNSECPGSLPEPFCYYYTSGPSNYEIECATQFSGPTLQQVYSQSLADCIFYCDYANSLNANSCLGVTYLDNPITQGGANNCFRYSSLSCATRGNATWDSARLLYPGYPAMTDYGNSSFTC